MAKNCSLVYLDENNKKSVDYYGNLHLGTENARKIYLEKMAKHAFSKFQKSSMSPDNFLKESRSIILPDEDGGINKYRTKMGKNLDRVTETLSLLQREFSEEETAALVTINTYAKNLVRDEPKRFGLTKKSVKKGFSLDDHPEALTEAEAWAEKDIDDFETKKQKTMDLWRAKAEKGTLIHNVLENYITARSKVEPDEDGDYNYESARAEALKTEGLKERHKNDYIKLINQIEKFMNGVGKNLRWETEVTISDDELDVAGRVDLMAFDDDNNVYIFDYKTKERGKEWLFDVKGGKYGKRMKDPAGDLWDNKETHGALQTSLYRLMMERKGFNVIESRIVYIEGDIIEDDYGNYDYKDLQHLKDVYLPNYRSQLGKFFKSNRGVDINKPRVIEEGKLNDVNDLLNFVTGQISFDDTRDIEKLVMDRVNSPLKDLDGDEHFWNQITASEEYFKSTDINERKKQLREYYKEEQKLSGNLSDNVIDFFNGGQEDWKGTGNRKYANIARRQAGNLLAGITRETHTLEKVKNIYGFEHIDENVLVAIDRHNKSARIINVSKRDPVTLSILGKNAEANKEKSLFQNFMKDSTLKYSYGIDGLEATDENLKLIRGSILAMQLKEQGMIKSVQSIANGSVTGFMQLNSDVVKPTMIGMNAMLKQIKVIADVTSAEQSAYMKDLLNSKDLTREGTYSTNYLNDLHRVIETGFRTLSKNNKEHLRASIHDYNDGIITRPEFIKQLIKTQNLIGQSLATNSRDNLPLNSDYRLVAQTILQLTYVDLEVGSISKSLSKENMVRTTSRVADRAVQFLDSKVKGTEQAINRKFKKYQAKHSKLVRDLMDANGFNGVSKVADSDMSKVFAKLYKVDPNQKMDDKDRQQNVNNLMVLKSESEVSHPAERAYIKFFNENVKEGFKLILSPTEYSKVKDGEKWQEGQVPLINASVANRIGKADGLKEKIKIALDANMNRPTKNTSDAFDAINTHLDSKYSEQLGIGIQNGKGRLKILGLDPEGNKAGTERNLETNLEAVLNRFMADNLRTALYEETLGVYNAINAVAFIEENEHFNSTKDVRDFMDNYIKLIVFNEHKEEGKGAQRLDKIQKTMTFAALGFSPKQIILEGTTNLFGSATAVLTQAMMGKQKRFNIKDYTAAGGMIIGDRVSGKFTPKDMSRAEAIARDFGLYKSDSEAQSREEQMESRKNGWFQSKWAYHLNNMPFKFFKTQTFIAELIHQGIMPSMDVDSEGNLIYNYSKDGRFKDKDGNSIFDKDGNPKDFTEPPRLSNGKRDTDHLYYKRKVWDSLMKEWEMEGSLDEGGKPTRPLPNKEISSMKDYALSLFGSIDKDAKVLMQANSYGRMFLKFKNWAVAKKDNYWTPTHLSEIRGDRILVEDEDGNSYYEWKAEKMEGVIQTVMQLFGGTQELFNAEIESSGKLSVLNPSNLVKNYKSMNRNQKENLARLLSDIIIVSILTAIFSAAFDDEYFKKGEGKIIAQATMNATSDLNVLRMGAGMVDGNPVAVLSWATRTIGNIFGGLGQVATGDIQDGVGSIAKVTGIGKSLWSLTE